MFRQLSPLSGIVRRRCSGGSFGLRGRIARALLSGLDIRDGRKARILCLLIGGRRLGGWLGQDSRSWTSGIRLIHHRRLFAALIALLLDLAPFSDIHAVAFERLGEDMSPRSVGNKIEIPGLGRRQGRLERCAAGIGDRARRQAIDAVSIIGRCLLDVLLAQRPVELGLAAGKAIDDGRIGLQGHALAQPVGEYRRHTRALFRHTGFLFDDRSEGERFCWRLDRRIRGPLRP